jgi:flagellar motor switch protein FliN/FliY
VPADLDAILKLEVPVIVQIANRTMPFEDVMSLAPGAIIELPKKADAELEILVNNKQIGLGSAVKVGENFGIRINTVGNVKDRIQALGAGKRPAAEGAAPGSPAPAPGTAPGAAPGSAPAANAA